ncbi:MAG TPA: hypothetical protein VD905_19170 [Flavobacteriales bacterium]|nr:hypothetical protein [Flavobacteriales bacterium]
MKTKKRKVQNYREYKPGRSLVAGHRYGGMAHGNRQYNQGPLYNQGGSYSASQGDYASGYSYRDQVNAPRKQYARHNYEGYGFDYDQLDDYYNHWNNRSGSRFNERRRNAGRENYKMNERNGFVLSRYDQDEYDRDLFDDNSDEEREKSYARFNDYYNDDYDLTGEEWYDDTYVQRSRNPRQGTHRDTRNAGTFSKNTRYEYGDTVAIEHRKTARKKSQGSKGRNKRSN